MKKYLTNSSLETENLGQKFGKSLRERDIVLLYGDLGAGKTTFVQGLAKGFNITDRILSPTFVLHRAHRVPDSDIKTLNHIDLYRIEKSNDIVSLGLDEIINEKESVTIIEWADKLSDFKPTKGYKIWFENIGEEKRKIRVEKI